MTDITPVVLEDLTTATLEGTGVFDTLMRATKVHLQEEYSRSRIKGPEYAQVYLGSLTEVMQQSLTFLLEKDKAFQQAKLITAQVALAEQQAANAIIEGQNLVLQSAILEQQALNLAAENEVMTRQMCKLQAEYDVLMEQKLKVVAEAGLLTQKRSTEKAQISSMGVEPNSIIGKQVALYHAQAEGFKRDAEQKAAKLMVDSWNVRRTTDEGTVADSTNMLSDQNIGRTISKLLNGVGA